MKKSVKNKIRKHLLRSAALVMVMLSAIALTACNENQAESSTPPTTQAVTTAPTTAPAPKDEDFDLSTLHSFDAEGGDSFAGVWKITDGQGSQFKSFSYMFDGYNGAFLFMGNTGYPESYSIDREGEDEQPVLTAHLMFGINGTYSFKFNQDKTEVVLTEIEEHTTTTLTKLEDFTYMPQPDENPVIDKNILGAWSSADGESFYFGEDGLMYHNLYNKIYTYCSYSAKDGKITASYSTGANTESDSYDYSLADGKLTLNGFEYNKISTAELQ